jgi:hypothetical protein
MEMFSALPIKVSPTHSDKIKSKLNKRLKLLEQYAGM